MITVSSQRSNFQPLLRSVPAKRKPQAACSAIDPVSAAVADHGQHLPAAKRFAAPDQLRQQPPADAPCPVAARAHVDRRDPRR
jgi:hypothetical protein